MAGFPNVEVTLLDTREVQTVIYALADKIEHLTAFVAGVLGVSPEEVTTKLMLDYATNREPGGA